MHGQLVRKKEALTKGLVRINRKLRLEEVPPALWELDFVLSMQTKATKSFFDWIGTNVDTSSSLLMNLIGTILDELPTFWCALLNYLEGLVPNFRIIYSWFCAWYQGDQACQLAAM